MAVLDYVAPATVDEAVAVLKQHGQSARVLAGGTDLIVQEREHRRDVGVMVDVKGIPELTEVTIGGDGSLKVGAAASCASLYRRILPSGCCRTF